MCCSYNSEFDFWSLLTDSTRYVVETDSEDEALPSVSLQEMLEDLHIGTDATGGEGDDMLE